MSTGPHDHDAIVVGGGHNGLICAAYLARAGLDTVVLEAREAAGGCASTVDALGARVNICNCDHVTFRTTPVADELDLARHGLAYLDVDPCQVTVPCGGGPAWALFHDVERTLAGLAATHPDEVEGYRRYAAAAVPVAELVLELAQAPPAPGGVVRRLAERRARGVSTLLRWSRLSAAQVLSQFFRSDALSAGAVVTGPSVWGLSPYTPRTGTGALTFALKHAAQVGRPVGGSGAVPVAVQAALEAAGGAVRTGACVRAIVCEGDRVRGVELADGTRLDAPVVVSACDPHATFVQWLRGPPPQADRLVGRWRAAPQHDGYESKLDAVVATPPQFPQAAGLAERLGFEAGTATTIVAPGLEDLHRAHALLGQGRVAERPMFFANTPSVLDPTMRAGDDHVFSLEVLFTPYRLQGGWTGSPEPQRWLEVFSTLVEPGFLAGVRRWRAMTPESYEREFFMPHGYATSFAGGPLAALLGKERELTRYETPVKGLYLTGAATFPGAGVWGASGRNAATVVLRGR
jgi:phytoene dehydrogenase-like protein